VVSVLRPAASNYSWNCAFIVSMAVCSADIRRPVAVLFKSLNPITLRGVYINFTPNTRSELETAERIIIHATNNFYTYSKSITRLEKCTPDGADVCFLNASFAFFLYASLTFTFTYCWYKLYR